MSYTLRVNILDREYVLRAEREEDARLTREIARYVDTKMRAFRKAHPERPELTTAVIAALAITEDLFSERERSAAFSASLEQEIAQAADELEAALR